MSAFSIARRGALVSWNPTSTSELAFRGRGKSTLGEGGSSGLVLGVGGALLATSLCRAMNISVSTARTRPVSAVQRKLSGQRFKGPSVQALKNLSHTRPKFCYLGHIAALDATSIRAFKGFSRSFAREGSEH